MSDEDRLNTMLPLSRVGVPVDESGPVSSAVLERSGKGPTGLLPQMMEAIPTPIMIVDEHYRVVVANDAVRRLLSSEGSRFLGYSVSRFLSVEKLVAAQTRLVLTAAVQCYRDTLFDAGVERGIDVHLNRLVHEGMQYLCMSLQDRTNDERERAEWQHSSSLPPVPKNRKASEPPVARLEHAHHLEALGHLTGSLAHDFNNLLSVVAGSLHAATRRLDAGEDPRGDLERATAATDRSMHYSVEILRYARARERTMDSIDPSTVLRKLQGLLERACGEARSFSLELKETPDVRAAASQLETAVLNLVINARDATQEGGQIEVATFERDVRTSETGALGLAAGPHVVIRVTDSGCGMSQEVQEHAFEPFYTTKKAGHGTGLGLSSVRSLMAQWGGAVHIRSQLKEGTQVELIFPALRVISG